MIDSTDSPLVLMVNNRPETLFTFRDFLFLVEQNMGYEAKEYLENYCGLGTPYQQLKTEFDALLDDYEELERNYEDLEYEHDDLKKSIEDLEYEHDELKKSIEKAIKK